jgi:hypothetical protein
MGGEGSAPRLSVKRKRAGPKTRPFLDEMNSKG